MCVEFQQSPREAFAFSNSQSSTTLVVTSSAELRLVKSVLQRVCKVIIYAFLDALGHADMPTMGPQGQ
jgi:hypothetical protein